jgi:hypothetical protein
MFCILHELLDEEGPQRSNRKVPGVVGGVNRNAAACTIVREPDRAIAEKSGPALAMRRSGSGYVLATLRRASIRFNASHAYVSISSDCQFKSRISEPAVLGLPHERGMVPVCGESYDNLGGRIGSAQAARLPTASVFARSRDEVLLPE